MLMCLGLVLSHIFSQGDFLPYSWISFHSNMWSTSLSSPCELQTNVSSSLLCFTWAFHILFIPQYKICSFSCFPYYTSILATKAVKPEDWEVSWLISISFTPPYSFSSLFIFIPVATVLLPTCFHCAGLPTFNIMVFYPVPPWTDYFLTLLKRWFIIWLYNLFPSLTLSILLMYFI